MHLKSIFLIGASLAVSHGALAQSRVRRICAADAKAQCAGVKPKGGALMDCMAEHRDQISVACKAAIGDQVLERRARKLTPAAAAPSPDAAPAPEAPTVK